MRGVWKMRRKLGQRCHVSKLFSNIGCSVFVHLERGHLEVAEVTFPFAAVHFVGAGWLIFDPSYVVPVASKLLGFKDGAPGHELQVDLVLTG